MLYKAKFSKTDKKLNREIIDTYSQIIAAEKYASVGSTSLSTVKMNLAVYSLQIYVYGCYKMLLHI